ncbi:glycosyltransferase [Rhodococcus sp. BP-252]|uniref:glycosyltransferase n=1 Tax=Nocardiaceae TaxID=85025 RepID=UPI0009FBA821|nr:MULTISPECIES: glycosyltransferase [Rhodococcus]MBY6410488.1 glycosyltransferase [Rhodococcus sp. BP-320]MBY6417783.1 glycosyltransferase [Rhodococcus sp. BP-321]MBY6420365.1 glycosyltransferase [Rhodococcus sp. BP-324]MBY6425044.1 glycosyltransferase [Rhodococcus sp. BP-323]MBY6430250.1 glycosyltransferase [Rhodococcus sp. BP-322]
MSEGRSLTPHVTVVIPTRNPIQLLDEQLNGLAKQNYPGAFDVVVSDNGGSADMADHVSSHPLKDALTLTYVDSSDSSGAAHARNRGVEAATGDFLAFCDADDVVHPTWLGELVTLAQQHDLVGTAVETTSLNSARALSWTPTTRPERQGKSPFLPFAIGASLGCWTSVYRDLGGMDNRYSTSQDVEFSWRAQLAGYSLGFSNEQLVAYRLRDEFKPLIRQSYRLGYGFAKLQGDYRDRGCPPVKVRRVLYWWTLLLLGNPLVPRFVVRVSRGQWVRAVAAHTGEVRGGIRYRTFGW